VTRDVCAASSPAAIAPVASTRTGALLPASCRFQRSPGTSRVVSGLPVPISLTFASPEARPAVGGVTTLSVAPAGSGQTAETACTATRRGSAIFAGTWGGRLARATP
jgi:hypothetical protein